MNPWLDRIPVCYYFPDPNLLLIARLGFVMGKAGKPSIAILEDFSLWLYNPAPTPIEVVAGELFGFGTGNYVEASVGEEQACAEGTGIVWRLRDDLMYLSHNKTLYPFCEFLKFLASNHGLGQVDLESHVLTQKYHPAASGLVYARRKSYHCLIIFVCGSVRFGFGTF